ncbi:MAG: nuclease [Proteobacteria bacterium]|nr:nuclease [Pseudomonadota bacterium]
MQTILDHLEASIADLRLSDDERRELVNLLRSHGAPEEGLRRVRNRAFEMVQTRLAAGLEAASLVRWLEGVARALDSARGNPVHSEVFFSPGDACQNTICQRFQAVQKSVDVCVFTLSDDRIRDAILAAHRRGVALRFITDNDKASDSGSDVETLRQAGISVVVDQTEAHMHHKYAIFDARWLLNGSFNWTRSASRYNEENLIITDDPELIACFSRHFEQLWIKLAGCENR